jgi:hypothetical protein
VEEKESSRENYTGPISKLTISLDFFTVTNLRHVMVHLALCAGPSKTMKRESPTILLSVGLTPGEDYMTKVTGTLSKPTSEQRSLILRF